MRSLPFDLVSSIGHATVDDATVGIDLIGAASATSPASQGTRPATVAAFYEAASVRHARVVVADGEGVAPRTGFECSGPCDQRRGNARAARMDAGIATLRGEVNGTPLYERTFTVTVSAAQTAADLRSEVRRFRQEQTALGWVEVLPLLCLEEGGGANHRSPSGSDGA